MNITLDQIRSDIEQSVRIALAEDIGTGDITAKLISAQTTARAQVITRENCVICGQAWFDESFRQLGIESIDWKVQEGQQVEANTVLVELEGSASTLLTGERTALNFLQLLSGVASLANRYAGASQGSSLKILDTRKTIPGLRTAQKYAVACGGCSNHRIGLFDAFLIKENHLAACGGIEAAIALARTIASDKAVEVEVESIDELKEALRCKADIIMLDNFDDGMLAEAQQLDKGDSKFEYSGNLSIEDINRIKHYTCIDYVSFGALTKHLRAIDLSFRLLDDA
jgi:nicotinate-nucleotide pyrophosphorylase (carboxylating)